MNNSAFFETNTSEILASVLFFCKAKPLEALPSSGFADSLLYHTKNYQGTITSVILRLRELEIIPYQELSGNYNTSLFALLEVLIIPYQELSGNYNVFYLGQTHEAIIPYQELSGNYNSVE